MSEYEAGREFDALVAEKVMGWLVVRDFNGAVGGGDPSWDEAVTRLPALVLYRAGGWSLHRGSGYETWRPSRDIAAAWEVVEEVGRDGWWIELTVGSESVVCTMAPLTWHLPWGEASADTAPLAICLAALQAIADPRLAAHHPESAVPNDKASGDTTAPMGEN